MDGNLPPLLINQSVYTPEVVHLRTDALSDWQDGHVTISPKGADLTEWAEVLEDLARGLDLTIEVCLNHETGVGFARANKGFPLEMQPYSPHALEWVQGQSDWGEMQASWNKLFRGEARGIC